MLDSYMYIVYIYSGYMSATDESVTIPLFTKKKLFTIQLLNPLHLESLYICILYMHIWTSNGSVTITNHNYYSLTSSLKLSAARLCVAISSREVCLNIAFSKKQKWPEIKEKGHRWSHNYVSQFPKIYDRLYDKRY